MAARKRELAARSIFDAQVAVTNEIARRKRAQLAVEDAKAKVSKPSDGRGGRQITAEEGHRLASERYAASRGRAARPPDGMTTRTYPFRIAR